MVAAIGDSARAENIACAHRLAAIAELYECRQIPVEDGNGRELWRIDPWEAVAAEVAAVQGITAAAAGAQLHDAICLHERLPKVAALFASGALPYRTALTHTVCDNDPRTIDQRRADALGALAAGHTMLPCACGLPDCPAETPSATSVVVYVVAEAAALDAADTADLNGERPGDRGPEIVCDPERFAELIRDANSPRPTPQPSTAPVVIPKSGRSAGWAGHPCGATGRLGRPKYRRAAIADPSRPEPIRTPLSTVSGTGRLYPLPRPLLPLP